MTRGRAPVGAEQPGEQHGLGWRLVALLGLVVLAGAVTLLVAALTVAPPVFQAHLSRALSAPVDPTVQRHVDEAFASAVLLSLGLAVPVALLTALTVAWVVARRLARTVGALAAAAERIATGDLAVRVQTPALGGELARLTSAFNAMADRVARTEATRRRLIGDLAHELRTPLAALEATVDAVTEGVLPADGTTMATLHDQTDRLSHLVADMAAVSKAEERVLVLEPGLLDLGRLVERVVSSHRPGFVAAGCVLVLDAGPAVPPVLGDPRRLGEVLDNLLANALEHAEAGGTVRVVVRGAAGSALVQVSDAGRGFSPADADRIFERFYRADPARTGSGIHSGVGLTIARAIVEAHGGTLTAASGGPGTGATFTVALPG